MCSHISYHPIIFFCLRCIVPLLCSSLSPYLPLPSVAMDVQFHSYSSFLTSMVLAISFFSAESHGHGESTPYSACNQNYSCGNISSVAYPFWGKNRPHYCGGGNQFQLTCQDDTTTLITLGQQNLTVVSINPEFHSMRLVQTALSVACPWNFTDTSLDPSLFRYDTLTVQNLSVFYLCPSHVSSQSNITCERGVAFFAKQDETQKFSECKVHSQILVQGEIPGVEDKDGLNRSVRNGFVVQYVEKWAPCWACNSSGGVCGTDIRDASRFACYCRNRVRPYSCPNSMTSSFFHLIIISAV